MKSILPLLTASLLFSIAAPAGAQSAPLKPIPIGTPVTLARPTDLDEVLLRLVGVQCVAASKLNRNADGTFDGTLTCGSVTIKGKRLAIDHRDGGTMTPAVSGPAVPMIDAKVASGQVTVLAIGAKDLFASRAGELVGQVCNVTKPLTRDAEGYYAGELTCGTNRFYFAQVKVASGAVTLPATTIAPVPPVTVRPRNGERWRVVDAGDVYPSINTTDCLAWPNADMKRRGGDNYWSSFAPQKGDVGVVLGVVRHCSQDIDVVLLEIGAFVVPIGAQGIERAP